MLLVCIDEDVVGREEDVDALILEDVLRVEDVFGLAGALGLDEDTAVGLDEDTAVGLEEDVFGLADPPEANDDDDFFRAEDMISRVRKVVVVLFVKKGRYRGRPLVLSRF